MQRMGMLVRVRREAPEDWKEVARASRYNCEQSFLWRALEATWALSASAFLTQVSSSGDIAQSLLSNVPGLKTTSLTSASPSPLQHVRVGSEPE